MSPVVPGSGNEAESGPMRLRFAFKLAWINLSLLVTGVVLLELAAYVYYTARVTVSGSGDEVAAWVDAIPADAYDDRSWLMTGFHELQGPAGLRWEPFTYWRYKPFSGRYVNLGTNGLRHTWNTPAAEPVEIWVFGGSTTWGTGARDDYTIPSALSKMLAQAFPARVHITNYGTTGYVNTQEMIFLFRELQQGRRPNIAIFYDGINDTYTAFQNRVAGVSSNEYNRVEEFNILRPFRSRAFFLEVLKRSNLYNLLKGIRTEFLERNSLHHYRSKSRVSWLIACCSATQ